MSEIYPSYECKHYMNNMFAPYTDTEKKEKFLHKIRDFILVSNFEPVDEENQSYGFVLFKGETVADLSNAFPFPSVVFFDLLKSEIVRGLDYNTRLVRVIKPENCYLSIEDCVRKEAIVDEVAKSSETNQCPTINSKVEVVAKDPIRALINDTNLTAKKSPSKRIITNRQLNFTLSPVDTHNSKEMPHKLQNYEIDGTWSHHQSIVLDVILDRIFNIGYQQYKSPLKSWRSKETVEVVDKFSGKLVNPALISYMNSSLVDAYAEHVGYDFRQKLKEDWDYKRDEPGQPSFEQYVKNDLARNQDYQEFIRSAREKVKSFYSDYTVGLNLLKLFEDYPLLRPYRYRIKDIIKGIEQTKFKMTYKVKYMRQKPTFDKDGNPVGSGELDDVIYRMNEFEQLFEIMAIEKDAIVLNFKSPLSKLIIHNMLILNTDWFPVEAMSLSKNAYFIYKRFVLNRRSGRRKAKSIELKLDELKTYLDLRWSNDRGVHAIIERALRDLNQNGLVAEYRSKKNIIKRRTYELRFKYEKKDAAK